MNAVRITNVVVMTECSPVCSLWDGNLVNKLHPMVGKELTLVRFQLLITCSNKWERRALQSIRIH